MKQVLLTKKQDIGPKVQGKGRRSEGATTISSRDIGGGGENKT